MRPFKLTTPPLSPPSPKTPKEISILTLFSPVQGNNYILYKTGPVLPSIFSILCFIIVPFPTLSEYLEIVQIWSPTCL